MAKAHQATGIKEKGRLRKAFAVATLSMMLCSTATAPISGLLGAPAAMVAMEFNTKGPRQVPEQWSHFIHAMPYHEYDSIQGVRLAAQGKGEDRAIDLDYHITKDGVAVNTHWTQPLLHDGFIDPQGKVSKEARVEDLTWAEVSRLRTPDGYAIQRAETMFALCADLGVRMEFEAKGSKAFENVATWKNLKALADKNGLTQRGLIQVKTLSTTTGAPARLAAAHAAGFITFILPRAARGTPKLSKKDYWPVADYVRGPVVWS